MKLERGIGNWVGKVAHNRGGIAKYPSPLAIVRSYRNGSIHRWFHAVSKILLFYCLFSNPARSVIALLAPPCANSRSKSSFNGVNRFSIRSRDPHDSFFRRPSTNPLRKYRHQGTESKARIREKYEVKVRSIFQPLRSSSF